MSIAAQKGEVTGSPAASMQALAVDVVVPMFNEERDLEPSVRLLYAYLTLRR